MTRRISKTSIRKVPFESEWQVKAYDQNGIRWPQADYFASSLDDAFNTAKEMMKKEEENEMERTPPVYSYAAFTHERKGGCFYISFSTNATTFSVFLSPEDLLKLQMQLEEAKKAQYTHIMSEDSNNG